MDNIEQNIAEVARKVAGIDEKLTNIFMEAFGLTNPENETNAGYMAYGTMAVDVALRLSNVFLALKNPDQHRTYRAVCDLTYELSANEFWHKNANVLMPILHVCLNTYRDGASLLLERAQRGEYSSSDMLISASRAAPLEIFPVIAYLVGGPALMASASLPLKTQLAPYFVK